jgi:hypothetical protein
MSAPACSELSLSLGEPLVATAPKAPAWLLVEQSGPWGAKALVESRFPRQVGEELERRSKAVGVKALLVKRVGSGSAAARRCFLVSSVQDATFVEELSVGEPADLLELDLEGLARGERPGLGQLVEHALYLVCTNSRRDACCAKHGRPVFRALAETQPSQVWECSHLGGHRFAANLVCLPHGLCYGRVRPESAVAIAEAYERGEIVLEHLRGRSSFSPLAQAADAVVREHEGVLEIDGIVLEEQGESEAVFGHVDGRRFRVVVRPAPADPPRRTSCRDEKLERPILWSRG